MSLPFNQAPADPSLKDLMDMLKKDVFLSLNCHHVGTIQSFDADSQTASVTINYKKTYFQLSPATGLYGPVLVDYPALVDCPVMFLGGALTFPVAAGDECLVFFNDRDMDNWLQGGAGSALATPRLHSFADGIILVGLRSQGNVLGDFDTTRAVLKNGTTMVGVGDSLVKIANDQYALNGLVQDLISEITDLTSAVNDLTSAAMNIIVTTPVGPSIPPLVNVASFPPIITALTQVSSNLTLVGNKFGELLE